MTAGSNAVVNLAAINQFGTDSTIQVGGDAYSDAMLYQAELIDTGANPTGVSLPALANEAVAFLSDDMLNPDAQQGSPLITPTTPEGVTTPDAMQTMLA